jgi:hypothetical protein
MGKNFVNPTDQARKEARKKELKKNKKQRLQVRQAVIKQKDPKHLLNDMELLDKMEFDPNNPPPYSAKVIQDKRKKLKETWTKIYQFYQREDPKQAYELKQMELEYERKHNHMSYVHESVMQAQRVKLDDIPLPQGDASQTFLSMPPPQAATTTTTTTLQPQAFVLNPVVAAAAPKSILKAVNPNTIANPASITSKDLLLKYASQLPKPPCNTSPPDLSEFECDDDEFELGLTLDDKFKPHVDTTKKIRFSTENDSSIVQQQQPPPPPSLQPIQLSSAYLSGKMSQQPTNNYRQQNAVVQAQHQRSAYQPNKNYSQGQVAKPPVPATTTTAPTDPANVTVPPKTSTIVAKPVLRNKVAEITRFVPTSLLVKRDTSHQTSLSGALSNSRDSVVTNFAPYDYMSHHQQSYTSSNPLNNNNKKSQSGDSGGDVITKQPSKLDSTDAYDSFMKEIGKLL